MPENKRLVSRIAYLLGINEKHFFEDHEFDEEEYKECDACYEAQEFRAFYQLRNFFLRNISSSPNGLSLLQIEENSRYPKEASMVLQEHAKLPRITGAGVEENIFYYNCEIARRLEAVYSLLNSLIQKEWYRELFTLPKIPLEGSYSKGYKDRILNEKEHYKSLPSSYPHHMYVRHVDMIGSTYILRNDIVFLEWIFYVYGKSVPSGANMIDYCSEGKEKIYGFIRNHTKCTLICDCENCNPFKLVSMFRGLKEEEVRGIDKIILCTDPNATFVWKYFEREVGIQTEFIMVERINEFKSLVDIRITAVVCEEYYKNGTDSFLIASSDSDFWGLFEALPGADFLVLLEKTKAGKCLIDAMNNNMMHYCCIDEFQSDGGSLRRTALKCCFEEELNASNVAIDMYQIAEAVMKHCRISEEEREDTEEWLEKNVINKIQLEWITKSEDGRRVKIPHFVVK